jgi:hypothetical protein
MSATKKPAPKKKHFQHEYKPEVVLDPYSETLTLAFKPGCNTSYAALAMTCGSQKVKIHPDNYRGKIQKISRTRQRKKIKRRRKTGQNWT